VTLLKYEEMVTNYRSWLTKFIRPFPLPDERGVIEELVVQSPAFFPERRVDVMAHVRHVAPGDHRNKLKPATIRQLNEMLGDILRALDYQ
jgi:hypothetical protein